jgi:hypothetical protein
MPMPLFLKNLLLALLLLAGVLLGLLVAGSVLALWAFGEAMCGNEVMAEYPSPGNQHRVVVFQRDCGATTGFSTQASLLDADEALGNEGGNLFVSDTKHGAAPAVSVVWMGERALVLRHHAAARVFRACRRGTGCGFRMRQTRGFRIREAPERRP